ncbi:hypothetical protein F2Q69_00042159 [Brassica cretica]|uniref:Uncharacterized protein n=1 Tax=Brassica cretica TaxID=69181 RepID=A0A8S9NH63_BRACR|nr:hypothetical protein F2Q69_00042159 [Brassica cretica]
MVAPLILVRDNNGDLYDQEGHLRNAVHAQQYQKQPGNSTAILTRSCKFGTFDPQGSALLIDRQQHFHLPSTNIFHLTSIDTPSQTSIVAEPREMVAPLILVRDNNGDLHDQEGHLRNAVGQRIDAQGAAIPEPDANATGTTLHVHVQQYQKQQGNSTAILTRSCMFGTFDPQGSALLIDRQQHLCVARFCSTTVDPDTSSVDRYSLTTVDNTHLPSTDIFHPTLIDTPFQTSIDTEPREMVAPLILVRDNNGDLHDHEGHLRNTTDDWENDYYNPAIAAYTRQHMYTEEYDEDYDEERATEYRAILGEEDKL